MLDRIVDRPDPDRTSKVERYLRGSTLEMSDKPVAQRCNEPGLKRTCPFALHLQRRKDDRILGIRIHNIRRMIELERGLRCQRCGGDLLELPDASRQRVTPVMPDRFRDEQGVSAIVRHGDTSTADLGKQACV